MNRRKTSINRIWRKIRFLFFFSGIFINSLYLTDAQKDDNLKQASQYDKIIKENLEITLPMIIRDLLGLDITESEELPDDIQHTKERKPDSLKKVTDVDGNTYVLHVEFQVEDEQEMVYRMAE